MLDSALTCPTPARPYPQFCYAMTLSCRKRQPVTHQSEGLGSTSTVFLLPLLVVDSEAPFRPTDLDFDKMYAVILRLCAISCVLRRKKRHMCEFYE